MDELLMKQLPHNVEAEQAVLGAMLIDPRCIPDVISLVKPDDFFVSVNRDVFEAMYTMFNYAEVIDPVTVLAHQQKNGTARENASKYLAELMSVTPTAANVMEYAAIVKDKALLRGIGAAAADISDMVFSQLGEGEEVLEAAEKKIYNLRQGRQSGGLTPVSTVLVDVYGMLSESAKNGNHIPGMETGLSDLDHMILGLNPSDLILIASRPGMGKTSIALNIALHVGKNTEKAVAIFSLEMSKEQLALRLLSGESFVDSQKLQTGNLSDDDWRRLASAAADISKTDIRIDDNPSLSVADMNAQCRRVKNLGLVVIDYLQLMQSASGNQGNRGENRTQVISEISRMLKIMSKELNVPVICLSQLSRANESRTDKRPLLSDLRESGAIEQDADIVLGLYREGYYDRETEHPNLAECIILKNRHGSVGTVELQWLPEFTTYSTLERRYEEGDVF